MEIKEKIELLVKVLDSRKLGMEASAPTSLADTKLLLSTLRKYEPDITQRVSSFSWFLLFSAYKDKLPESNINEFTEKFLKSTIGIEALQETTAYVSQTLSPEVSYEEALAVIEEANKAAGAATSKR